MCVQSKIGIDIRLVYFEQGGTRSLRAVEASFLCMIAFVVSLNIAAQF